MSTKKTKFKIGMRFGIAAKLYALLALMMIAMLAVSGVNLKLVGNLKTDTTDLAEQQISDLKHVMSIIADLETAQKGFYAYLAYEDADKKAEFLAEYEQSKVDLEREFDEFAEAAIALGESDYELLMSFKAFVLSGYDGMDYVIGLSDAGAGQAEIEAAIAEMQETLDAIQGEMNSMSADCESRITASKETMYGTFTISTRTSVIFLILSVILVAAITLMTAKTVHPITMVSDRMRKMAEGDLHTPIQSIGTKDESGVLMQAVADMMKELNGMLGETSRVLKHMAEADFSQRVTGDFAGDLLPFKDTLNDILHKMRKMLRQIHNATSQVENGSSQMAQLSESLASTVTQQTAIMDNLNENIRGLLDSAKENATSAEDAAKMAGLAIDSVNISEQHMNDLFLAIEKIEQFSHEIEKINKTVSDIAFQTNILSLNAAVEAARAGEAGKGFAVVAGEVKALAEKSSEASHDVSELIGNTVGAIRDGLAIAKKTSDYMNDTVTHTQTVSERIKSISHMSGQQLEKLEYIQGSMTEFSDSLTVTAAASEESSATAQELKTQSDKLADLVDHFKIKS